jgi:hypothetical protein
MARLVAASSSSPGLSRRSRSGGSVQCFDYRNGRDEPGHDRVGTATSLLVLPEHRSSMWRGRSFFRNRPASHLTSNQFTAAAGASSACCSISQRPGLSATNAMRAVCRPATVMVSSQ